MSSMIKQKKKCSYTRHICSRFRYREYKFCYQHILEDKSAPFVLCQYISKITKRRCRNPALKADHASHSTIMMCEFHKKLKSDSQKMKSLRKANSKIESRRHLSQHKSNHLKVFKKYSSETNADYMKDTADVKKDEIHFHDADFDSKSNNKWLTSMSPAWKSGETEIDVDISDDGEDYLRNAGTYALEEVMSVSRERLVKLQSLYIDQFKQLQRKLEEKRRNFIVAKSNKDGQEEKPRSREKDEEKMLQFQALAKFRRHSKMNKLLHKKMIKRRFQATHGPTIMQVELPVAKSRCCHMTSHTRCKKSCLPYTKYCVMHILEDPLQVLYKKCSYESCTVPVSLLHYSVKKKENVDENSCFCSLHETLSPVSNDLVEMMKQIKENMIKRDEVHDEVEIDVIHVKQNEEKSDGIDDEKKVSPNLEHDLDEQESDKDKSKLDEVPQVKADTVPEKSSMEISDENNSMDIEENNDKNKKNNGEEKLNMNVTKPLQVPEHTDELDQLGTGQCYIMRRVALCDKETMSPGLHLQPIINVTSKSNDLILPQVTESSKNSIQRPVAHGNMSDEQTAVLQNLNKSNACSATVHHHGSIMLIANQSDKSMNETSQKQVVQTSATLVPPLQVESDVTDSTTTNNNARTEIPKKKDIEAAKLSGMPWLSPITKSAAKRHLQTVKDNNNATHKEEVPGSNVNKEKKSNNGVKQSGENMEPSHKNASGDESIYSSAGDRKPSSADEEAAIASLLSLSSGNLPSENIQSN